MAKTNTANFEPTLGKLIAAAGELAFECSDNDKEAHEVARQALIEMIRNELRAPDNNGIAMEGFSGSQFTH